MKLINNKMSETVKYTRFSPADDSDPSTVLLIADAIYDVSDSVTIVDDVYEHNDITVVNDAQASDVSTTITNKVNQASQADRVVLMKDKPWIMNELEGYLYTKREIRAADGLITTEPATSTYYKFNVHEYGLFDVCYVKYDSLYTESERYIICSSSSGVWLLVITNGHITLNHVNGSKCCCHVLIDTLKTGYFGYVWSANILCFDSYTATFTATSSEIISVKNCSNSGSSRYWIQKTTHQITDGTTTTSISAYFSSSPNLSATESIIKSCVEVSGTTTPTIKSISWYTSTGWLSTYGNTRTSHITVSYTNSSSSTSTINRLRFHIWFPLAFDVSASDSPSGDALTRTTLTDNICQQVESKQDLYFTSDTRWGAIWRTNDITDSSVWTSWISKLDNTLISCPSIYKASVGSNLTDDSANGGLYYFLTDTYNDYLSGWRLPMDSETNYIIHAFDMPTREPTFKWLERVWNSVYHNYETTETYTDDLFVFCSTSGIMSFHNDGSGSWLKVFSPEVDGKYFTGYHQVKAGNYTMYEYAFDPLNQTLRGLYRLTTEWWRYDNWIDGTTKKYTACVFKDSSGTATINAASILTILDNDTLIFAISCGNAGSGSARYDSGVWVSADGTNFQMLFNFTRFGCSGAFMYNKCLWLFGHGYYNATIGNCNRVICLGGLGDALTIAEAYKNLTIKTVIGGSFNEPYDKILKVRLGISIDNQDNINVLNYRERAVKFNGAINNDNATITDLNTKITELKSLL